MKTPQQAAKTPQVVPGNQVGATLEGLANKEQVTKYLHEALESLLAAGRSGYELVTFSVDKFGHAVVPHLEKLQQDIRQGSVTVQHLTEATQTAVFGLNVSAEQREQMIREAAYYRAEKRGFAEANADEDWLAAQQEIDAIIAQQAGVVAKARKTVDSALASTEKELAHAKSAVVQWLGKKSSPREKVN